LKGIELSSDLKFDVLTKKTKGYSGADISNVCRDATMMPLRKKLLEGKLSLEEISHIKQEDIDIPITMQDFMDALKNISKSVSKENLEDYAKWMAEFGCV
jgi:katanin p60 ATPase-containing subunit A1